MCIGMSVDRIGLCTDMRMEMRIDMRTDMRIGIHRHLSWFMRAWTCAWDVCASVWPTVVLFLPFIREGSMCHGALTRHGRHSPVGMCLDMCLDMY